MVPCFVACLTRSDRPTVYHSDWVPTMIYYFGIPNGRPIFGSLTSRKSRACPIRQRRIHSSHDWLIRFGVSTWITFFSGILPTLHELDAFRQHYNQQRVHQPLNGLTPESVSNNVQSRCSLLDHYSWQSDCNGLFQTPIAAWSMNSPWTTSNSWTAPTSN